MQCKKAPHDISVRIFPHWNIATALVYDLSTIGFQICTRRSDLAFLNSHIETVAMPCPTCLVAKRRIEDFSILEIKGFADHLKLSHGMER